MNEDYLELKYSEIPYAVESGATDSVEATAHLLQIEGGSQVPDSDLKQEDDIVDAELVED